MALLQTSLFDRGPLRVDATFGSARRLPLTDGAWLELVVGWVSGHAELFEALRAGVRFHEERREMYERIVTVPRLHAVLPEDGAIPPVVEEMRGLLERRYAERFPRLSVAHYRDGRDSVAWHGDYVARRLPQALVATVSLGAPRRFLLRPAAGGRSRALLLGEGDLLVMGGTCQRTWRHSIPKVAHAGPRMAVMFRPVWDDPETQSQSRL